MQLSLSEALYYNQFTCLVYLQFRHLGQEPLALFAGNALEQISLGLSNSFPQRLPREAFHASSHSPSPHPRPAVKVTFFTFNLTMLSSVAVITICQSLFTRLTWLLDGAFHGDKTRVYA